MRITKKEIETLRDGVKQLKEDAKKFASKELRIREEEYWRGREETYQYLLDNYEW